jgi:hypothetical protein
LAITSSPKNFLLFLLTGTVCGIFLDGAAQWLAKLWVYPYWNTVFYACCFVIGFGAYWLLLAETYFLAHCAFRKLSSAKAKARHRQDPQVKTKLLCGATGLALAALGLALAIQQYTAAGGYVFAVTAPSAVHAPFYCFLLITAGTFLILEYVSNTPARSLLGAVRLHDWAPLCAILTAGWITGFFMETANAAQHFWLYTNWPLPQMTFCHVPVIVLILWPIQYVVFLSAFRAFTGTAVWE